MNCVEGQGTGGHAGVPQTHFRTQRQPTVLLVNINTAATINSFLMTCISRQNLLVSA